MSEILAFIIDDTFSIQLIIYSIILVITFTYLLRAVFFFKVDKDPLNAIKPSFPKLNWFQRGIQTDKINKSFEEQG